MPKRLWDNFLAQFNLANKNLMKSVTNLPSDTLFIFALIKPSPVLSSLFKKVLFIYKPQEGHTLPQCVVYLAWGGGRLNGI